MCHWQHCKAWRSNPQIFVNLIIQGIASPPEEAGQAVPPPPSDGAQRNDEDV